MTRNSDIKNKIRLPKIVWVVLCAIIVVNVSLVVFTSSNSAVLFDLESKKSQLEKEILATHSQLVRESALSQVSKVAGELGMETPGKIYFLNTPDSVAMSGNR